jgi:hypothetical protein
MVAGAGDTRFCGTTLGETRNDVMLLNAEGNAFVSTSGQVKIKPFRAYFSLPGVDSFLLPDVEPDGMTKIEFTDRNDDILYNMSGQRVSVPQRGIYIKNHKKILVW